MRIQYVYVLEKTTIGSEADVVVEEKLPLMGAQPKGGKEKRRRLLRQPNTEAHVYKIVHSSQKLCTFFNILCAQVTLTF